VIAFIGWALAAFLLGPNEFFGTFPEESKN
jgi:hypothetical protein